MYNSNFFLNEAAEKIFYLTQMTGEAKTRALGITRRHFASTDAAKTWRDNLLKVIHPDVCQHPLAVEATAEVNRIYAEMTAR